MLVVLPHDHLSLVLCRLTVVLPGMDGWRMIALLCLWARVPARPGYVQGPRLNEIMIVARETSGEPGRGSAGYIDGHDVLHPQTSAG